MLTSFVRTLILYLFIIVALRLMGKRQVGELEPSELVSAILISGIGGLSLTFGNLKITSIACSLIRLFEMSITSSIGAPQRSLVGSSCRLFIALHQIFFRPLSR